jgi:hypothetical protein
VDPTQEAHLREIRNYEVRLSARFVLDGDGLRHAGRGRRNRTIRAVICDALSCSLSRQECQQRQNEDKDTNNSCKLPIHSGFSKGE